MQVESQQVAEARLGQIIGGYLSTLPMEDRENVARELGRFARWIGNETPLNSITPADVSRFQEQLPETAVDINSRLQPVKSFLTSLKTQHLTDVNLGAYIRLRRPPAKRNRSEGSRREPDEVLVTEEGFANLTSELQNLENVVRPAATDDLRRAAADKDFRENAPYDAAKQKLSEIQTRINDIHRTLAAASIYVSESTETVDLGTIVSLHSLLDNEELSYTIVGPGEVSPRDGKISVQSPVGKALFDRRAGEVVEVLTPAGSHTYRIDRIERR